MMIQEDKALQEGDSRSRYAHGPIRTVQADLDDRAIRKSAIEVRPNCSL